MNKKYMLCISIILLTGIFINKKESIPKESIRFRIIANSNEVADQALKMNIKDEVGNYLFNKTNKSSNIEETRHIINQEQNNIKEILDKHNMEYNIKYGLNYFPKKEYEDITYNEGEYESLVITLGEGKGKNWWCVMYPPLCTLENTSTKDVQYKSYLKESLSKIFD